MSMDQPREIDEPAPWTCTCCAAPTQFRLGGVELCPGCALNLIESRSRELHRDPAAGTRRWPVAGMRCGRRGHRPTKRSTKKKLVVHARPVGDDGLALFTHPTPDPEAVN